MRSVRLLSVILIFYVLFSGCRENSLHKQILSNAVEKYLDTARIKLDEGDKKAAIAYIDSIRKVSKIPYTEDKFEIYGFYYQCYYKANDYEKALRYTDSMRYVLDHGKRGENYDQFYAAINYAKGDILFQLRNYDEAFEYYYKAKLIGKNSVDVCSLTDYSYRMGMVTYKQGLYAKAATFFKQSLREQNQCSRTDFAAFYRKQELINNIALSFTKVGQQDSAILYYNKGLTFLDENISMFKGRLFSYEAAKGVIYGNMGNAYQQKKEYNTAEQLMRKSISINTQKSHENLDAQLIQVQLAGLYLEKGDVEMARKTLQEARDNLDTLTNVSAEIKWNDLMWQYFAKTDDQDNAFVYLRNFNRLSDSINNLNQQLKESDVSEQLQGLENQYEIGLLKKENQLQQTYRNLAILFSIMAVVIVLLIYNNFRRSKKNISQLTALNSQISQQKEQLEEALASLNDTVNEKDRILRTVAHDLRNPLGGVESLSYLMLSDEMTKEDQDEMLRLINNAATDTLNLIRDILEVSENKFDKLPDFKATNINLLVNDTVELLRFHAATKNQKINVAVPEGDYFISIDREKIGRVLNNLISNAIKFSRPDASISVTLEKKSGHAQIKVSDKGIGIPDYMQESVFENFTTSKQQGTAGEKSYGLGLSICKQIVEQHHGSIWFNSVQNEGTDFFVKLPEQQATGN